MKVGYAARWSPLDKRSWSGTSYYSYQQITRKYPVEIFTFKWPGYLREWLTTQKSLNRILFGKHTSVEFLAAYAKYFSRRLDAELKKRPVDLLFVSASPQLFAYAKTKIPIIFMIDATFQQIQAYYPYFSNLAACNIKQGIELDRLAFKRADHCMLASEWNKASAVRDYGMDPGKITVVPCGANLDMIPEGSELVHERSNACRLLFIGVEWERKGGQIALDTFRMLKKRNFHARLTIVGCIPPDFEKEQFQNEGINVIPYLDKNEPGDSARLHELLKQTDLFFLPTRAECAGVVFSESSAFGIPSITTDTGGVCSYVENGINGFALPLKASVEDYAEKIIEVFSDPNRYRELRNSSKKRYEDSLNWNNWGSAFVRIAEQMAAK